MPKWGTNPQFAIFLAGSFNHYTSAPPYMITYSISHIAHTTNILIDLVKLKKFQKSEKNSDCPENTNPPAYTIFWKHVRGKKQHKKHNIAPKKRNSSWGLTHPPTSEFFSDFFNYFNLTKPLSKKMLNRRT